MFLGKVVQSNYPLLGMAEEWWIRVGGRGREFLWVNQPGKGDGTGLQHLGSTSPSLSEDEGLLFLA